MLSHKIDFVFPLFFIVSTILLSISVFVLLFGTLPGPIALLPLFLLFLFTGICGYTNPIFGIGIVLAILAFQPLLTMPLAHYANESTIKAIVASKELVAVSFFVGLFLKNKGKCTFHRADRGALLFLFVYTLYLFVGSAPLFLKIVSFRHGFMIVFLYFLGRFLFVDLKKFVKVIIFISLAVIFFGFFERIFIGAEGWLFWGNIDYIQKKYGMQYFIRTIEGMPNNWFFAFDYGEDWLHVRRTVGPMGEGTSFARFVSFPATLFLFNGIFNEEIRDSKSLFFWKLTGFFIMLGLMLSFGKGGTAIFFLAFGVWFLDRVKPIFIILAIPVGVAIMFFLVEFIASNLFRHFFGLAKGILAMIENPFGHGLGSSGQAAVSFGEDLIDEKISESYVGGLAYQIGIFGLISYFLLFYVWIKYFYFTYKKFKARNDLKYKLALMIIPLLTGIFLTSFLANSSITPASAGLSFIFSGFLVTYFNTEQHAGVTQV